MYIGAASRLDGGWRVHRFRPYASLHAALLEEYAVAAGWLVAAIVISLCLAVALAGSIAGPLQSLDRAVGEFDIGLDQELPRPPAAAPREVAAIFDRLNGLVSRLRAVHGEFRQAQKQGERLRRELTNVIGNRETEIRNRTDELRRANAALEHLTRFDALTGSANRRALAEFTDRAWRTAMREQQPLSIIVVDLDHFRAYNEASGTSRGDTCLKAIADAIRQIVSRASDLVCRYGGEEFVIVLGNTPLDGALAVAEQIRAAIESLAIPHRAEPGHGVLTVSAGVSSTVPSRNSQPDGLLVAAERALHTAKELGRNQVAYSTAARTGLYQSLCLPNDIAAARPS
jgi:diguanylate cyclase (GGDEF)-like protein